MSMKQENTEVGVLVESGRHNLRKPWKAIVGGTLLAGGTRLLEVVDPALRTRDILPDPFDLPNYAGNFSVTTVLAVATMSAMQDEGRPLSKEQFQRERKVRAAAVGALAVGANAFAELVGYGPMSTPDPFDFIHGVGAAALVYQGMKPGFLSEKEIESDKKMLKDHSRKEGLTTGQESALRTLQTFSKSIRDYTKKTK